MDVLVDEEERDVLRSVPTSETLSNEQDRSQVILKEMFKGEKTYDNRTGEIQLSRMSRTGFPTRLKCNKVRIDKEKTSRMIVRKKLSKRAVVKEDGLG